MEGFWAFYPSAAFRLGRDVFSRCVSSRRIFLSTFQSPLLGIKRQNVPKTVFAKFGKTQTRLWLQNEVRAHWTGSGPPSYIQVGPRESDFRGPGALKPQFKAQKPSKLILLIFCFFLAFLVFVCLITRDRFCKKVMQNEMITFLHK